MPVPEIIQEHHQEGDPENKERRRKEKIVADIEPVDAPEEKEYSVKEQHARPEDLPAQVLRKSADDSAEAEKNHKPEEDVPESYLDNMEFMKKKRGTEQNQGDAKPRNLPFDRIHWLVPEKLNDGQFFFG